MRIPIRTVLSAALVMLGGCADQSEKALESVDGEAAYGANCLACHQADGRGVPYFQPPLVGSPWLQGEPQALAAFVLTGGFNSAARKEGPNENVMPAFTHLDDATLAAALTYVRSRFGNGAGPVTPDVVREARRQIAP
jgi:mono/diheme cytochrome c family protein